MKAVILAGGFGKRLRPYTSEKPKPLVEVAGKPILVWQIEWLKKYGFNEIVLLVGYLREKIIDYIGSGSRLGVRATYIVEDEPLGTGGALKNAEPVLRNEEFFIAMNGDIITNLNPMRLVERLQEKREAVTIATVPLKSPYGVLEIDSEGRIQSFREKPVLTEYWINAGIYAMTPKVFDYLPVKGDIERTAFPKLASENLLGAVRYEDVFWKSIDTYKDVEEAARELTMLAERPVASIS